jgi:hypothetical protein
MPIWIYVPPEFAGHAGAFDFSAANGVSSRRRRFAAKILP